jgi:hypothetical protein
MSASLDRDFVSPLQDPNAVPDVSLICSASISARGSRGTISLLIRIYVQGKLVATNSFSGYESVSGTVRASVPASPDDRIAVCSIDWSGAWNGFVDKYLALPGVDPVVTLTEANVETDRIVTQLGPFIMRPGRLRVVLKPGGDAPAGADYVIQDVDGVSPGTPVWGFNAESIPNGSYSSVEVTWTTGSKSVTATRPVAFKVLGQRNHTRYNTPTERYCPDDPTVTGLYEATYYICDFYEDQFRPVYLDQFRINGSGRSIKFGPAQKSWTCDNIQPQRLVDVIRTADGVIVHDGLIAMQTVNMTALGLRRGDRILMVGGGDRVVGDLNDTCDGCDVDHYTTAEACMRHDPSILSYGMRQTIRLR